MDWKHCRLRLNYSPAGAAPQEKGWKNMAENQEFTMEKVYNPQQVEDKLYEMWEDSGAFVAHRVEGKKPFTIVMPPPNITGQLHMGHAMDCLCRTCPFAITA